MEGTMKIINYQRYGGLRPTPNNEILKIEDDGKFRMWRSVSTASIPPSPIGRFEGKLEAELNAQLWYAADAAAATGDFEIVPLPDSVIDTIKLPNAQASMGIYQQPRGPWNNLIGLLRPLLSELALFPRAAIALEVLNGGRAARLVHRGTEPLLLDLSTMKIQAILWQEEDLINRWSEPQTTFGDKVVLSAAEEWLLNLPFGHGFNITQESHVIAYVRFKAFDGEVFLPVSLESE